MLRQFLAAILARDYYCECGYSTNDKELFESHIKRHSANIGHLDTSSGAVVW